MNVARIVSVLAAIALPGQSAQQCTLRVQVHDPSGTAIANARVHVKGFSPDLRTDQQGLAIVSVPPGQYSVSVGALSFTSWSGLIDVSPRSHDALNVQLRIPWYGPVLVNPIGSPELRIEPLLPAASIQSLPLERLIVPARKLTLGHSHRGDTKTAGEDHDSE